MNTTERLAQQFQNELGNKVIPAKAVLEASHIDIDGPAYKAYAEIAKSGEYLFQRMRPYKGAVQAVYGELEGDWNNKAPAPILRERKNLAAVSIMEATKGILSLFEGEEPDALTFVSKLGITLLRLADDFVTLSMPDYEEAVISEFQGNRKKVFADNNRNMVKLSAAILLNGKTRSVFVSTKGKINVSQLARGVASDVPHLKERAIADHIRTLIKSGELAATG